MNKSNSTEKKMLNIMMENKYGISISDLCREHRIDRSLYYRWLDKFELKEEIKKLKTENVKLRKMYVEEWRRSREL